MYVQNAGKFTFAAGAPVIVIYRRYYYTMLYTPVCRSAGLPVVVCCRNLLRAATTTNIEPCSIHADTVPARVVLCSNVTTGKPGESVCAGSTFAVAVVRDGGVFPGTYTFADSCAAYIATLPDIPPAKNTRPPNCS